MNKLLSLLFVLSFTFTLNAQQTEDEVYIGKGKTFGNFRSTDTKPINGQSLITGNVVGICKRDCCNRTPNTCSMLVQLSDSSIVTVNLVNSEFTVPRNIYGQHVTIQGNDRNLVQPVRPRKDLDNNKRKDIPFTATGIKIL